MNIDKSFPTLKLQKKYVYRPANSMSFCRINMALDSTNREAKTFLCKV